MRKWLLIIEESRNGIQRKWLKIEKQGKIHGGVITNGAVTGRCTHQAPNVAQVPSVTVPYGQECRELFYAPDGYKLVGVDVSGLELRCLAHYLAKYDDGTDTRQLVVKLNHENMSSKEWVDVENGDRAFKILTINAKTGKKTMAIKQKFNGRRC